MLIRLLEAFVWRSHGTFLPESRDRERGEEESGTLIDLGIGGI